MKQNLTAKMMTKYLKISYQGLDKWCREGLLGEKHAQSMGHGKSRQFGLADVVLGRLLKEIFSFGCSFDRARNLARMFHINMKNEGPRNVVLTLKAGRNAQFLITREFKDSIEHLHESILAIPVVAVFKDARQNFPQLEVPASWKIGR